MTRSIKPSVWIQTRKTKTKLKTYLVRRTVNGRELPSIPCGADKEHAIKVRDRERARLWEKRLQLAPATSPTLAEQTKSYLAERRVHQAPSTVVNDERALALFDEYAGGATRLDAVDKDLVRGFIPWMLKKDYARAPGAAAARYRYKPNGVRILLRSLKTFFRAALADEKIPRDPFFKVVLPPEEDVARPPTDEDVKKLWEHLTPRARAALTVDAALGLRRREILGITGASLTPPARAGAPWVLKVRKSKTRRGKVEYKVMAVPAVAMAALEALRPWPKEGPIVPVHESTLTHWVSDAAKAAGLGRLRLHDFRHRWATELMSAAKDEYALMQVGGWTSRAAVARYQHGTESRRDSTLAVKWRVPPHALHTDAPKGKPKKTHSSTETSS